MSVSRSFFPSLRDFCRGDPGRDAVLSFRALRIFPASTFCLPRCRRLVLPLHCRHEEVFKAEVSSWLPGPSGRLFQSSGEEDDRRFRALEVRIFASSLLSRRILSAAQVLRAGVWPRQTTFPSFYLGISLTGPGIRFPWILWWWLRALCNLPGSSDTVVLSPGLRFCAGGPF